MQPAAADPVPKDRLKRFREMRARLDPSGDPAHAMGELYVAASRSVSSRISAELALSPASSHLLIGGVGSGKTTELLAAQRTVSQVGDVHARYIDISKRCDIGEMEPGALVILVGQELESVFDPYLSSTIFSRPPKMGVNLLQTLETLPELMKALRVRSQQLVVMLDGLDRMTNIQGFEQIVSYDVKTLTSAGIGVVLVGPLRALYGIDRTVTESFDSFHYQPWIDVTQSPEGAEFLADVLRKRIPDVIDPPAIDALVRASGGVLRDLLALAQSALVEAYMAGAERIGAHEVRCAVDAFGRKHLQGLRPTEIEALQRVRTRGTFVHTSEDDLALLMTRRVLEYRNEGELRYAVHPTIDRLLQELAAK